MYNDVKLEKGMYNLSGKSFTAALEELDPPPLTSARNSKISTLLKDS